MNKLRFIKDHYFGQGEWEAYFGLFGDVFSKIAAIIGVLYFAEGFPAEIVMGKMLPGIGVGSIAGCLIYFGEAYVLGKSENRTDVTALPFGISSTQVFAWIFLIIVPIYHQTGNALLAWQIAIAACCLGGFIEIIGGFVSSFLVRYIPNSALMGNMAAGALVWLSFNGFITVFQTPVISVVPLFFIILAFKMKKPFIKKIPNTLLILVLGAVLSWVTGYCNVAGLRESASMFGFYPPSLSLMDVFAGFGKIGPYLSIIVPLQIANFISTMQAVQSASMSGDRYPVKRSMILDGVTTVISSLTGSPFPTSVYYGHPGWKKVGAKSGYALLMAATYFTCFFGLPLIILEIIPYEVIIILLVFVGLTVSAEVVDNLEKEYSSVIFVSLFPILAQYIFNIINDVLGVAGTSVAEIGVEKFAQASVMVSAFQVLSYGAFASSLLYAAWMAYVYRRKFKLAGVTALILAFLSAIGFIHCERICWLPAQGVVFSIVYLAIGSLCFVVEAIEKPER
ncbi:MAG: uracil permease [Hespellia sp.]|nr:uracil permease [Hespellia sp.]